jgi:hypothetical protein
MIRRLARELIEADAGHIAQLTPDLDPHVRLTRRPVQILPVQRQVVRLVDLHAAGIGKAREFRIRKEIDIGRGLEMG